MRTSLMFFSCCACADLFAAGYGSFDARRQGPGAAVCFSLKDPINPIFERQTVSGDLVSFVSEHMPL